MLKIVMPLIPVVGTTWTVPLMGGKFMPIEKLATPACVVFAISALNTSVVAVGQGCPKIGEISVLLVWFIYNGGVSSQVIGKFAKSKPEY